MTDLVRTSGQTSMLPGAVLVGDLVFTSGIIDPRILGGEVPPPAEQARGALRALLHTVAAAGGGPDSVVRVEAYIADPGHIDAWNEAYKEVWPVPGPARTTLVVGFALPAISVELQAVAVATSS